MVLDQYLLNEWMVYSRPSISMGFATVGSTDLGLKIFLKIAQSWSLHNTYNNYLHSISIVLGFISNLEVVYNIRHFRKGTWASAEFGTGGGGPGTNPPTDTEGRLLASASEYCTLWSTGVPWRVRQETEVPRHGKAHWPWIP